MHVKILGVCRESFCRKKKIEISHFAWSAAKLGETLHFCRYILKTMRFVYMDVVMENTAVV